MKPERRIGFPAQDRSSASKNPAGGTETCSHHAPSSKNRSNHHRSNRDKIQMRAAPEQTEGKASSQPARANSRGKLRRELKRSNRTRPPARELRAGLD
jgi:hypothetical protein